MQIANLEAATDRSVDALYTALELCVLRSADPSNHALETEVIRFARVSPDLLARLVARPLVLGRQVATPTNETAQFFALAARVHRPPLIMTMPEDRFTPAVNAWKRGLVKLTFETRHQTRHVTVASFDQAEKKRLCDIRCRDGTPLLGLHEELLTAALGKRSVDIAFDGSRFFASKDRRQRYERFFALFTCFGVLAENYILAGHERAFLEEAVLPAFESTIWRFGRPPLITRLLPSEDELDPRWDRYPAQLLARALRAAGRAVAAQKLER